MTRLMTLAALATGVAAMAQAAPTMTRARLTVAGSASGPARLCLTPHARGDVLLPGERLPRQACLSARQWALRGVVLR